MLKYIPELLHVRTYSYFNVLRVVLSTEYTATTVYRPTATSRVLAVCANGPVRPLQMPRIRWKSSIAPRNPVSSAGEVFERPMPAYHIKIITCAFGEGNPDDLRGDRFGSPSLGEDDP